MKCAAFAQDRVLAACGEKHGGRRHLASCPTCAAEVRDYREIRRLYAAAKPVRLNDRTRKSIVAAIRRDRSGARVRSAVATIAGIAAALLVLAGAGGGPAGEALAEPVPAGASIDRGIAEVRDRIASVEAPAPAFFDEELADLRERVEALEALEF